MASYETLDVTREGHLTWLTLNRPDALNSLSTRLVNELRDFVWRLPDDREARVLEDRNQVLAVQSEDFREGVRAFLEKREAKFQDR